MNDLDERIINISNIICENIDAFDISKRGLLAQNILQQLRNFVEVISVKYYSRQFPNENVVYDYDNIKKSIAYLEIGKKEIRFLREFHKLLQMSVSHYSPSYTSAERLMLKYYEFLLKTKTFVKEKYNLEILQNITKFPVRGSPELERYYKQIAEIIDTSSYEDVKYGRRFYIQKKKPFFIDSNIYYELTLTPANDEVTKFDRVIAFTNKSIPHNYAVNISLESESLHIDEKTMPVFIISKWKTSIRPCELKNFARITGTNCKITKNSHEYTALMDYLTYNECSLLDIIKSPDYEIIKNTIIRNSSSIGFFDSLDIAREIVVKREPGYNVLSYLLFIMNNKILKNQLYPYTNNYLSNLCLRNGCIPFEKMPFCTSLIKHNPKSYILGGCIDFTDREHELFASSLQDCITNNSLYIKRDELSMFKNIDDLIIRYNSKLYKTHQNRKIISEHNYLYFKENEDTLIELLQKLKLYTKIGINNYTNFANTFLNSNQIDSDEKKKVISNLFSDTKISLIYGAAGTGKSTLLNFISQLFHNVNKIFLANTNPAVNNLQRKITAKKSKFYTISNCLAQEKMDCDILFIDECSTVANSDLLKVLEHVNTKAIILTGDIYQIESIDFGNWFRFAKELLPKKCIHELTSQYRCSDSNLLLLWNTVRKMENSIIEIIEYGKFSKVLDSTIFTTSDTDDEIILCLNYDGLYGVNNINKFLQANNRNMGVIWGAFSYFEGDPILFNDNKRFKPLLYNNLKGRILRIEIHEEGKFVKFTIEIDKVLSEFDVADYDLVLEESDSSSKSIISFIVHANFNTDEDDTGLDTIIPFQVAYAISIHKAQGLEYDKVKLIINDEIEEEITHNIFYTAITRARKSLSIYWTPETEKKIIENMKSVKLGADIEIITNKLKSNLIP